MTAIIGQLELDREFEVAFVVRGNRHDRAGAVACQHVVGHPNRDLFAVDRIDRVASCEDAGFLAITLGPFAIRFERAPFHNRI